MSAVFDDVDLVVRFKSQVNSFLLLNWLDFYSLFLFFLLILLGLGLTEGTSVCMGHVLFLVWSLVLVAIIISF